MKKLYFLYCFLFTTFFSFSQDFQWAYEVGEVSSLNNYAAINSIVTDSQRNVYATGYFNETYDFDPSSNSSILTSTNNASDGFLLKLDENKNFMWVKQLISNGYGMGKSVILDSNENIVITGLTAGQQIDLDPDVTNQYIVNNPGGGSGSYIIKLDSNGNFIFGKFYPDYFAKEVAVDNDNNIITIGNIGTANSLNNKIYIQKSDTNGSLLWTKLIVGNNIFPHSLTCDNSNNIILKGNFMNNMIFSNITHSSSGYKDFICKLNTNGQEIWYRKLGDTGSAGISTEDKSIKTDNFNNIYFSSKYIGASTIDFGNTTLTLPYITGTESALFKINENGGHIWNIPIFGYERQEINSINIDNNGDIFLIMFVNGPTFMNNQNTQLQLSTNGLLLKFNNSGIFLAKKYIPNYAFSVDIDSENNILIGGSFNGQHDFDPSPSNQYLMNSFRGNGYILKLGPCDTNTPNGASNQVFCSGENPTITNLSPNSGSIKWYDSLISATPLPGNTALIDGQSYYAAQQAGNCPETDRLAVAVHINPTPTAPSTSNQSFCASENATIMNLIATGQNLKWYDSQTGGIPLIASTILQNNTVYYVSQTINSCESGRTPVSVIITPSNLPTVTSPQQFCVQQNTTLNDITISGQNIKWYAALTGGNVLPNSTPLINGTTYFVTQTINTCESLRLPVLINIQNTAAPTGTAIQSLCSTQSPTVNDIIVTGTNLLWYTATSGGMAIPNTTPLVSGMTYYASQTVNSCESTGRLAVMISLISSLPTNNYAASICDNLNDNTETVTLANYNSYLIANPSGYSFAYYHTFNGAENQDLTDVVNSSFNLTTGLNTIFVRITNSNGCSSIVTLGLTLLGSPIITLADDYYLCENSVLAIHGTPSYDSYLWSDGSTNNTIIVNQAGVYTLTVTKNHNTPNGIITCSATKSFNVILSNAATILPFETYDWTLDNNIITVNVSGLGNYEYSLDGIHYQQSNVFYDLGNGEYTVYVKDKNGCGIKTNDTYLLMYPKFFTPNADSYNDYWKIKFSDNEPHLTVKIFDRYGKLMKQFGVNSAGWDGTYEGVPAVATDYWFVVTRQNGTEHRGHFTLKR